MSMMLNVISHYITKHSSLLDIIVGQARVDKIEHLKNSIEKQQGVFNTYKKKLELLTKLSFNLCECMTEKGKPFTDGEFIKQCWRIFTEYACPQKKHLLEQTSLSRFTVSCRIIDFSFKENLKERLKLCKAFNLALDESTDISDTPKLVSFIRVVTADFDTVEEFLDMASLSSTTTGKDICKQVLKVVENFKLNPAKLCGVTTHGVPSMTGRINGFSKNFQNAVGAQNVIVSHCIIHQRTCAPKFWIFQKSWEMLSSV